MVFEEPIAQVLAVAYTPGGILEPRRNHLRTSVVERTPWKKERGNNRASYGRFVSAYPRPLCCGSRVELYLGEVLLFLLPTVVEYYSK